MPAFILSLFLSFLAAVAFGEGSAEDSPIGFFADSWEEQAEAEAIFLATPAPEKMRRWLARLTEEPHVAGTPAEKKLAEYVRDQLAGFGLETEMVSYDVFLNHPRKVGLRLTQPLTEELMLEEAPIAGDKDSSTHGVFPGFHGYGASGHAAGQVVYANHGTAADFATLDELGVSVAGRIVLVRYGGVLRGLKIREAEARGSVGVVIYSDPADDGYMRGDIYPDGPMRPPSALQRGSVQYLSLQPGDPSTPGYPSRADAERVERAQMKFVPHIPSLPLSYGEAEKILRHLGGPEVPDGWQGGLPFAYHVGPGTAALAMDVEMDEGLRPIYNVFARLPGSVEAEQLVILGNHRDAWAHGAVDPNSGTAALLETARALAAAREEGWQPRRTILLASWDAEEYGLVGSVEWGEDRAEDLRARTVAYVNLDGAVFGGNLDAGGSPSLRDVMRQVAMAVDDPLRAGSVGAAWEKQLRKDWAAAAPVELDEPDPPFVANLEPLGSGSDFTVFLDHLCIPVLDFGFNGRYGVYHSAYDNFRWMERFGDPQFVYHAAAARIYGLLAMRLASPEVVPLRFGSYAATLRRHLDDLRRRAIREARTQPPPDADAKPPLSPDFAPVLAALDRLAAAGGAADRAIDTVIAEQNATAARALNTAVIQIERAFLVADGLPERPWFRHLLFAPGITTGYAAWIFPELTEALESRDLELWSRGVERVVAALDEASRRLEQISSRP